MHLLLVEDDQDLQKLLARELGKEGHEITTASTRAEANDRIRAHAYQALIVDWMLPDGTGLGLTTVFREQQPGAAIIVITAKVDPNDRITALDAGVDDILSKPFKPSELGARIRAVCRRVYGNPGQTIGNVTILADGGGVRVGKQELPLTRTELAVLLCLARNVGNVVPFAEVLAAMSADIDEHGRHTAEVHVSRVRKKLEAAEASVTITSRRGQGYRLKPADE